jgi:hypothetical protein
MSDQQSRLIASLKYLVKLPYRAFRRAGMDRRFPPLAGGRGWRTAVPLNMHVSLIHGLVGYRYRGRHVAPY